MKLSLPIPGAGVILLAILLAGCASPSQPTRFYRMDRGAVAETTRNLMPDAHTQVIGVAPVSVAPYLDRPQIVERLTEHRLKLHEFDQWAGSIQDNLKVTFGDALQQVLPAKRVVTAPWPGNLQPDYRLGLVIQQFDWVGERVVVKGTWSLVNERTHDLAALQQVSFDEPLEGSDVDAVVAAANRSIMRWARMIAAWFETLH
jgi:uncharacterized protein